jgi:hypothetical protein
MGVGSGNNVEGVGCVVAAGGVGAGVAMVGGMVGVGSGAAKKGWLAVAAGAWVQEW